MNAMVSNVIGFLVSEDGPTAVEYGVMLAIIIAVVRARQMVSPTDGIWAEKISRRSCGDRFAGRQSDE